MTNQSQSAREMMVGRPSGILDLAKQSGGKLFGPLTWNISFTEETWDEFVQALLATQTAPGQAVAWREGLERIEVLFDTIAKSYLGYLPDRERGFGTSDSQAREKLIEDVTSAFRNRMDEMAIALAARPQDGRNPATIEACAKAAEAAELPDGFRWGRDAMEQFDFGKKRAAIALLQTESKA